MMRRALAMTLCAAAILTPACATDAEGPADAVRAALRRTARTPRTFAYEEGAQGRELVVRGVVDDDYRYKAGTALNGVPVAEEVVRDDAVAVRFLQAAAADLFVDEAAAVDGRVLTGAWVVDPSGAPDPVVVGSGKRTRGEDAVLDALTFFGYVRDALGEAQSVVKYNPEALDYVAADDVFPKPDDDEGVVRYDLRAPRIVDPVPGEEGRGLPEVANFRRMAIYIQSGLVTEVREVIDVATRVDRLVDALGLEPPPGARSGSARTEFVLQELNRARALQGSPPVVPRRVTFRLTRLEARPSIDLPPDAVEGSLVGLRYRGPAPAE